MHRRAQRDGLTFEVVPPDGRRALLPDLRAISDAWLAQKHTREKGFSLGFFAPDYLRRLPARRRAARRARWSASRTSSRAPSARRCPAT